MKYQDLVIKNGKFIGKFEELYSNFDNPWNQADLNYVNNSISRQTVINFIKIFNIKKIVEVGCGLGHTQNFIFKNTNIDILGIDISKSGIEKARNNYPNLNFKVENVKNICNYPSYDAYFFSEITWYLLEENLLKKIFFEMSNKLKGKYFIHNLVFYRGQQKYGNDYFTNLNEFIKYCPFELIAKVEIDITTNDTIETSSIFRIK